MAETENLDDDLLDDLDGDTPLDDLDPDNDDLDDEDVISDVEEDDDLDLGDQVEDSDDAPSQDGVFQRVKSWIAEHKRLALIGGSVVLILLVGLGFFLGDSKPKSSDTKTGQTVDTQAFSKQLEQQKKKKKKKKRKKKKVKYAVLYKKLTGEQLSEIMRELSYEEIQYDITQNGSQFDISVDKDRLEEAKKILAVKEIPTGKVRGYELFDDASNLGVTEFDKRIRLIRAISGEMEKTIMRFDAIDNAQVEIVMPEERLFAVTQPPVTASILLRSAEEYEINDELVFAIIQLVSNSVENLKPENISVADTTGRVLSTGILDRMSEEERKRRLDSIKSQRKSVVSVRQKGTPIEPELDDMLNWFQVKSSYESLLENKAMAQLKGVLPDDSYKVAVTVDLNSLKGSGTPDIRRIVASVVVDNAREDVVLDDYLNRQVQSAVAGAVGFVRGRDTILISKADFIDSKTKEDGVKIDPEKVEEKLYETPVTAYVRYWPVFMLGAVPLGLILLISKLVARLFRKKEIVEEEEEPELEEEEIFEESVPEFFMEDVTAESSSEDNMEKILLEVEENPEYIAKLMQDLLIEADALPSANVEEDGEVVAEDADSEDPISAEETELNLDLEDQEAEELPVTEDEERT